MNTIISLLAVAQLLQGTWITDAEMAQKTPRPVEARQSQRDKLPPLDKSLRNRHILFRRMFVLGPVASAKVRITADD